jgi:ubiquinol-cytochrome c reductase cytochrome c1 subunit
MRELKVLIVVVVFTLITYWGVEPFAHSQMHPHVEPADYEYKDVDGLNGLTGNATNGASLVQTNCTACHSIEKEGFPPVMDDATSAARFKDGRIHPMPGYEWMQPQEIADMVAYLQSIAPEKMTNKEVFADACQRCHGIKYGDMKGGTMAAHTPNENIKAYMEVEVNHTYIHLSITLKNT